MNSWRSRLLTGVLLFTAMQMHSEVSIMLPNTQGGMLAFHGSAALVDLFLIFCVPIFIRGQICSDVQLLCLISMVMNFCGWIGYLSYATPDLYNASMWGLSYVQWGRLLWKDNHDAYHLWGDMVYRADSIGS